MHDLVIINAKIVDGTGEKSFSGDISINNGLISQVGKLDSYLSKNTIDAKGHIVTPGFVDIHTHYDAQVTWDPYITPSSWHGVSTIVMGNCGVGFAPAKPDKHDWLIDLMEGVEDIPGSAMTEGIKWGWETFPEYLDYIDRQKRVLDIGALIPHGAVRAYVMGERGAKNESANTDDIKKMSEIVLDGLKAGALGFSTSRTLIHKSKDGEYVPGTFAEENELFGIGKTLSEVNHAVFQMTSNHIDMDKEFVWMKKLAQEIDRNVMFNLVQTDERPELWKDMLKMTEEAQQEGIKVIAQVAGRPAGVLMGWQTTVHPFVGYPSYQALLNLPVKERLEKLSDPEVKNKIINDTAIDLGDFGNFITKSFNKMFPLNSDSEPDYEPVIEKNLLNLAKSKNLSPQEIAYDLMLENDGQSLIYFPLFNYSNFNLDQIREMLLHTGSCISLGDGGAHCGAVCDASIPTFMITYWVKNRNRGERLDLEFVVKKQSYDTAKAYGMNDRGLIKSGMKADINIIDLENLKLLAPEMVFDLPAQGRRLIQKAEGYLYNIVNGEITFQNGEPTGNMPGKLIRGN